MRRLSPLLVAAIIAAFAILAPSGSSAPRHQRPRSGSAPPLITIDLANQTVTAFDTTGAQVDPIDSGSEVSFTVADSSAPLTYRLAIPLESDEHIWLLSGGGAVVVRELLPPPDIPDVEEEESGTAIAAGETDDLPSAEPGDDASTEDEENEIEDDQDLSWYPDGDELPSNAREGWDIVDDTVDQIDVPDDDVEYETISAFDPPVATDVDNHTVPVQFEKRAGGLAIRIEPESSSLFPIAVTLRYGFDPDTNTPPDADVSDLEASPGSVSLSRLRAQAARQASSCTNPKPQVIVSYTKNYRYLAHALKKNPTKCAVYSISIPHQNLEPRRGSAAVVKKLSNKARTRKEKKTYPYWNSSGARFRPAAEINYSTIEEKGLSYLVTARTFARQMRPRGYGMWSIDEAICAMVEDDPDGQYWKNLVDLVDGLSSRNARGTIFNCYRYQNDNPPDDSKHNIPSKKRKTANEKKNLKRMYVDRNWGRLSDTQYWAQESYTMCSTVCVGGSSLGQIAARTNAYMQHLARLAFAPDAPGRAEQARSFFESRYLPLINSFAPVNGSHHTGDLDLAQMNRLVRLQVYAARAWARPSNPYAGARIGVRWTDKLGNGWEEADRQALAKTVARSVSGAYGPTGSARKACRGSVRNCMPVKEGASFTNAWSKFRLWNVPTKPPENTGAPQPPNPHVLSGTLEPDSTMTFDPPESWRGSRPLEVTYHWLGCYIWPDQPTHCSSLDDFGPLFWEDPGDGGEWVEVLDYDGTVTMPPYGPASLEDCAVGGYQMGWREDRLKIAVVAEGRNEFGEASTSYIFPGELPQGGCIYW